MIPNYYIPHPEEVKIGLIYEIKPIEGYDSSNNPVYSDWISTTIENEVELYDFHCKLKKQPENLRVKYLDKDDILSLDGFNCVKECTSDNIREWLFKKRTSMNSDVDLFIQLILPQNKAFEINNIFITLESTDHQIDDVLFDGTIKNLTELKNLLTKQLNNL